MKRRKLNKRLALNKKTVADLNSHQMTNVHGGDVSGLPTCGVSNCCETLDCPVQETSGCGGSVGGFYSCEGTCNSICMVSMCELTECC